MMKNNGNDLAPYLFHQGTNFRSYRYLGVHKVRGKWIFRVWAPNASAVCVAGDFNGWGDSCRMTRITDGGVWEASLPDGEFSTGQLYKFKITAADGRELYKADPYAFFCEKPPATASVCYVSNYKWRDGGWRRFRKRQSKELYSKPLNIYELHIGSWRRHEDGSFLNYRELASALAPYVRKMGYTHVELMPVAEHPYDGSWGYQVCGYYAPSARWGEPDDLRAFVDEMHNAGIGVIFDWVPAHFPKDAHGLYEFDGQPLYEYQGEDRKEHAGWGTRRFDVGREEVECFLISNAVFLAEQFHADGIRVDAVASMLYLDYDKKPGEWVPNIYGDNRCLEAIAFFRKLNSVMAEEYPDVMMIAEESTAWAHITGFDNGGLGFTYKWNMGWMNDTLNYAETDPYFRSGNHARLTFPICYSFSEKYILPISHDEVVHGKRSFLDKMPGEYNAKFAQARLFMAYRICFPGKKLSFMGEEIGQFREWDYEGQIEWFLLGYDSHRKLSEYAAALNHFYLSRPELYELDCEMRGFEWIYPDMKDISVTAFRRRAKDGKELIVTLNFTPVTRDDFMLEVPKAGSYAEIFNSESTEFGGSGIINSGEFESVRKDGKDFVKISLPPFGCAIFEKIRKQ